MPNVLLVEKSEGIATLTLNRPEAMNALSFELRRVLSAGVDPGEIAARRRAIQERGRHQRGTGPRS